VLWLILLFHLVCKLNIMSYHGYLAGTRDDEPSTTKSAGGEKPCCILVVLAIIFHFLV